MYDDEPLVRALDAAVADVFAPAAQRVDRDGVPPSHVEALRRCGVLGADAPVALGGGGVAAPVQRELAERLSAACGSTWFVATQHRTPTRVAVESDNPSVVSSHGRLLASGERLAGVAISHLRRPGEPPVVARRVDGRWQVDGFVAWVTSWGLADVVLLGAQSGHDLLFFLVPAQVQPGVSASGPLPLAAMGGTRTVSLRLDGLRVDDADLAATVPVEEWRAADALRTTNTPPAVFGLIRAAVARLRETELGGPLADTVERSAADVRRAAYRLVDEVPADEHLDERLELRVAALDLATRATAGLVAASAGRGMALDQPAQRLAREALFHLVQMQTRALRERTLAGFEARLRG